MALGSALADIAEARLAAARVGAHIEPVGAQGRRDSRLRLIVPGVATLVVAFHAAAIEWAPAAHVEWLVTARVAGRIVGTAIDEHAVTTHVASALRDGGLARGVVALAGAAAALTLELLRSLCLAPGSPLRILDAQGTIASRSAVGFRALAAKATDGSVVAVSITVDTRALSVIATVESSPPRRVALIPVGSGALVCDIGALLV